MVLVGLVLCIKGTVEMEGHVHQTPALILKNLMKTELVLNVLHFKEHKKLEMVVHTVDLIYALNDKKYLKMEDVMVAKTMRGPKTIARNADLINVHQFKLLLS